MLLYRPRAITYEDAMKQVLLFDDLPEMNRFLRNYHNLPEQSSVILFLIGLQVPLNPLSSFRYGRFAV